MQTKKHVKKNTTQHLNLKYIESHKSMHSLCYKISESNLNLKQIYDNLTPTSFLVKLELGINEKRYSFPNYDPEKGSEINGLNKCYKIITENKKKISFTNLLHLYVFHSGESYYMVLRKNMILIRVRSKHTAEKIINIFCGMINEKSLFDASILSKHIMSISIYGHFTHEFAKTSIETETDNIFKKLTDVVYKSINKKYTIVFSPSSSNKVTLSSNKFNDKKQLLTEFDLVMKDILKCGDACAYCSKLKDPNDSNDSNENDLNDSNENDLNDLNVSNKMIDPDNLNENTNAFGDNYKIFASKLFIDI